MKNKRYDKAYCDPITAFMDLGCTHKDSVPYDLKGTPKRITAMREVCTNCGRISRWAKVTGYTQGGSCEYIIEF